MLIRITVSGYVSRGSIALLSPGQIILLRRPWLEVPEVCVVIKKVY